MPNVIGVHWFSGKDTVGIVLCKDEQTDQTKCYIGVAYGNSEALDAELIAEYGSKVNKLVAEATFGELENYAW